MMMDAGDTTVVYALFPPLPRRDPPLHFVPRGGGDDDEDEDERRQKVRPFSRKQGAEIIGPP